MFRNNSYHLNKPRFPEVQIREAWVSWGGKYCFSTPERKEAVYSKLAMRNAFCLLSLTLDNISYLSFRSFSRDCAGWVLPRADDSGPPTVFWMRHITLSHTPSPGCRLHTFSSGPRLPWLIASGLSRFTKFRASSRKPANLGIIQRWEAISDFITEEKTTQRYVMS